MSGKVQFSYRWFNPLYFHLRKYIKEEGIRKIMVYGGKSSSKTFSIAQLFSILCYIDNASMFCFRKEGVTVRTTLLPSFAKAVESTYMHNVFREMDFLFRCSNNEHIRFGGIDKEGKVKGIESYKYLLFDELDHFDKIDWDTANISLRGIPNQKLLATWNPIDENSWIKQEIDGHKWNDLPNIIDDKEYTRLDDSSFVRLSENGKVLLIKTTYLDNKWMVGGNGYGYRDENLIDEYTNLQRLDENSYNVNVMGEWGVRDKNIKFAYAFSREKHVKNFVPALISLYGTPYNPNYIVWLSFDFNVNPMTCSCVQHYDSMVFFFKCFKLENSNTYAMCDHIRSYFAKGTIFKVTGDSTGANRNTLSSDNMHNYEIIQKKLYLQDQQMFVPTKNPDLQKNQVLTNAVLNNYDVWIQPGKEYCDDLIYDLSYVEVDENKNIKKDRSSDKKNADFLDTARYFFNIEFPNFLKEF